MDATISPSAATNARLAPAARPGRSWGSVTRLSVRQRPAPRLAAASSSDGSSCRYAASTAVAVVLALAAGWLVVRRRVALRRAIEALLALPWALPGTVFAIALAITFSVHAPLQLRFVLVGTAVILPLAFLVRALPLTGRGVLAAYRQLDPSLEEAAASLGAGRWRTLMRVTLPQLRPGLAAGASLAFVAALGDIVASIVLYTYETRPVSIEILSSLRLSETGVAAAFGVVLMLVSAVVLGVGARR